MICPSLLARAQTSVHVPDAQNLLDPKVKKQLILVFHAWSIQYAVSVIACSCSAVAPDADVPG